MIEKRINEIIGMQTTDEDMDEIKKELEEIVQAEQQMNLADVPTHANLLAENNNQTAAIMPPTEPRRNDDDNNQDSSNFSSKKFYVGIGGIGTILIGSILLAFVCKRLLDIYI